MHGSEVHQLRYTFDRPEEASRHRVQHFELFGSRGIYADGWWAGSPKGSPWGQVFGAPAPPPEERPWELYHLDEDYSQAHDLAGQNPAKLEEMKALFDAEARRNQVYPLEPELGPQPSVTTARTRFVYHAGVRRVPPASAPSLVGRAHRITAEVILPDSGAEGVIVAQGGRQGGYTLYVDDGRVTYETNAYGHLTGTLTSSEAVAAGKAKVVVEITPAGRPQAAQPGARRSVPMRARLIVNGELVAESELLMASSGDTLDIGSDLVSPVSPKYEIPFEFSGKVEEVVVEVLKM